jgi:hypothetical protein
VAHEAKTTPKIKKSSIRKLGRAFMRNRRLIEANAQFQMSAGSGEAEMTVVVPKTIACGQWEPP